MPALKTVTALFGVLALFLAGCADDDSSSSPGETEPDPTTSAPTTSAPTTSTTPAPTTTGSPGSEMTRCSNPEGFSIAYPDDWSVNDGGVVEPCSQFHPGSFEVPDGTDERVASITAYVDPVPFHTVTTPSEEVVSRASTEVDGQQAVRLETVAGNDSFYPEGTAATFYMVDLTDGIGQEGETLFLDVMDLTFVDYPRAKSVLDQMFKTLELGGAGDESTVARYQGASTSITVRAEAADDELCLSFQQANIEECVGIPEDGSVTAARLGDDLSPVIVGAAGPDVFRLVAVEEGVHRTAFLPTSVPGAEVRGWAMPGTLSDLDYIETYAASGEALGSIAIDESGAPAPAG